MEYLTLIWEHLPWWSNRLRSTDLGLQTSFTIGGLARVFLKLFCEGKSHSLEAMSALVMDLHLARRRCIRWPERFCLNHQRVVAASSPRGVEDWLGRPEYPPAPSHSLPRHVQTKVAQAFLHPLLWLPALPPRRRSAR